MTAQGNLSIATTAIEQPGASLYNPAATEKCSLPLRQFIHEYDDIIGAFIFTVNMAAKGLR